MKYFEYFIFSKKSDCIKKYNAPSVKGIKAISENKGPVIPPNCMWNIIAKIEAPRADNTLVEKTLKILYKKYTAIETHYVCTIPTVSIILPPVINKNGTINKWKPIGLQFLCANNSYIKPKKS